MKSPRTGPCLRRQGCGCDKGKAFKYIARRPSKSRQTMKNGLRVAPQAVGHE
jgi:hypothetical protein